MFNPRNRWKKIGNMNISHKRVRLLLPVMFILLAGVSAVAQEVSFTGQAPKSVVAGERFRITYTVNTRGVKGFRAPDMNGLTVLTGPRESSSFSMQSINGKTTEQTSITYTFVVVADEEGQINLDGATIQVGGNQLTSNKLTINVLPPDQTTAAQSQNAGQGSARSAQQQGSTASAGIIFWPETEMFRVDF